jgi:hypothetical protein
MPTLAPHILALPPGKWQRLDFPEDPQVRPVRGIAGSLTDPCTAWQIEFRNADACLGKQEHVVDSPAPASRDLGGSLWRQKRWVDFAIDHSSLGMASSRG